MCKNDGENANHLYLHDDVAWELWSMVLCLFGVSWVMPFCIGVVGLLDGEVCQVVMQFIFKSIWLLAYVV